MTYEPIEWKALVDAARTPDSIAWLYKHAETHLRDSRLLPDIAEKLRTIFQASKKHRVKDLSHFAEHSIEFVSTEGRAIAICAAIGLNTKTGRKSSPPTSSKLLASGLPLDLAQFVAERFEAAHKAAADTQNPKFRARAVTTALFLNTPAGAVPARERRLCPTRSKKTVVVNSSFAQHGKVTVECFEDVTKKQPGIPPEVLVAAIDSVVEIRNYHRKYGNGTPLPSIREICQNIATKFGRDPVWVESLYYQEKKEYVL